MAHNTSRRSLDLVLSSGSRLIVRKKPRGSRMSGERGFFGARTTLHCPSEARARYPSSLPVRHTTPSSVQFTRDPNSL